MWYRIVIYFAAVTLIVMPAAALAHVTGASYETTVDGYKIDIGYDPQSPQSGDRLILDFSIKDPTTGDAEDYDDVLVEPTLDGALLFSTRIAKADIGPTTLLLQVPDDRAGTLVVPVTFERSGGKLARASFTVAVARVGGFSFGAVAWSLIGFAVGALVALGAVLAMQRLYPLSSRTV